MGHHGAPRVCVSVAPKQTRGGRATPARARPAMTHATRDAQAAFAPRPRSRGSRVFIVPPLEYLTFGVCISIQPPAPRGLASLLPRSAPPPVVVPRPRSKARQRRAIPPDLIRHESRVVRPPITLPFPCLPCPAHHRDLCSYCSRNSVGFSLVAVGCVVRMELAGI